MASGEGFSHVNVDLNKFPVNLLDEKDANTAYGTTNEIHPLNDIEYKHVYKTILERDARVARTFGSQEVLKSSIECNMCAKSSRLPGMKSSMLSLEILMGELDSIKPYEYVNTEKPTNEFGIGGIHSHIENRMGI
ncbi:hypothetical protein BEWA_021120 [Theileria equi strain WA]|uniref:Uncharacterized protein n=1 Tax=Theileria equi strain WA TaxID=1537102 RepID=L0AUN7_THEEQ|nr:hypothetical protein BEWA_021120 [Theileria equi strain WA]AFZ79265.1 hypothetical protein BEWA_021120 [Theileria equi strain WA]|eukprot:XP_004828931.1 hypothetical protein BEWA_021120 [Theileria equi strain WA]